MRKHLFLVLLILSALCQARPASAAGDEKYSWAPNLGWINWRVGETGGAAFTSSFAAGYLYSPAIGWINLGSGAPKNGKYYGNAAADDFGVNVQFMGPRGYYLLSGYAWSPNIGWINFSMGARIGMENLPRIDARTGKLKGAAWSANAGWILLETPALATVDTFLRDAVGEWFHYQ